MLERGVAKRRGPPLCATALRLTQKLPAGGLGSREHEWFDLPPDIGPLPTAFEMGDPASTHGDGNSVLMPAPPRRLQDMGRAQRCRRSFGQCDPGGVSSPTGSASVGVSSAGVNCCGPKVV